MAPRDYVVYFAQSHHEFRIPELQSVAETFSFKFSFLREPDTSRPCMVLRLEEENARVLARRCILIKSIYELYGEGSSYGEIHQQTLACKELWERFIPDASFKFTISSFNHSISQTRQQKIVESFSYMNLQGKIDMISPQITFGCFEEYECRNYAHCKKSDDDRQFTRAYFGRLIEEGSARALIKKFDVKKRSYLGNTSMEAEISLLMANQTLACPGKFMYDPFMGTGSMAYPVAHFGAFVFGSDIDGRQMRGKEKVPGVIRAAQQYNVSSRIVDLCTFDMTNHPWRCGGIFDAIITDPPYGVRAGAKRLGRVKEMTDAQKEVYHAHMIARVDEKPYFPPTKPYELSQLVRDLVELARYLLKPHGRLVFFLATVNDEYEEIDVHAMICEGMEVIANSLQDFGSWGRRLITIRKVTTDAHPPPTFVHSESTSSAPREHVPAHKDFREKYFQGFKKG
ncbi:tRNA guanosine-2'-O-methyltransferase [Fistulina hepatica ATCC 64428]|uniref:tRNA (guanine(10)-N(2))-methyltransferase n=1 Tax=Fistulina hepatica ATCC 64428 TaxID=1128425 RepID=A0A0D7A1Z5_9AGAR|nr:tRNA guanosine-2'-O-methyltransferase [Fistulina hepatica ATCC 64428]